MSKKNFTGGINSLLGGETTKVESPQEEQKEKDLKELLEEFLSKPKRGRPKTVFKEITKTSQVGTKPNETRASFILDELILENIKAIAYWDRVMIKEVVNRALLLEITKYESENGKIQKIPNK